MASRTRALSDLALALDGRPRPGADWMEVLRLANAALVTPAIWSAALTCASVGGLPQDVRVFAREVRRRNLERNRRLLEELQTAVRALEAAGVEPVLLKGAGVWASLGRPEPFDRMLNDLDLLIEPAQTDRSIEALERAGFAVRNRYEGREPHVVAELARPERDVGFLDLHQRPPGPPAMAEAPPLGRLCRRHPWRGVTLRVPLPAVQVYFLVLHDQFHDGAYWKGGFSLRHLIDIAALSKGPEGVDWTLLKSLAPTRLVRHAIGVQLRAARAIFGAEIPDSALEGFPARLAHARHMAQFRWPALALPLGALGVLSELPTLLAHRKADREGRVRLWGEAAAASPPAERLRRVQRIASGAVMGKV